MSPSFEAIAPYALGVAVLCALIYLAWAVRSQQSRVSGGQRPSETTPSDVGTIPQDDSAFLLLSQRIAVVEGRLGPISVSLESVAILNQRVAAMEANMPSVQQAMEHYSDAINRADKRDTERARRTQKTSQDSKTAGEAAADLMGVPGAGGETPPLTQPGASNNNDKPKPMAGLYGSGGRHR